MDTSALIVVIVGTLLFFGAIIWIEFYSRRKAKTDRQTEME